MRVDEKLLDWNGMYYFEGKPFTGVAEERRADGTLWTETAILNGVEHGPYREWNADGLLTAEWTHDGGAVHGVLRKRHDNGRLAEETEYLWGYNMKSTKWDYDGEVLLRMELKPDDLTYREAMRIAANNRQEAK